jgi:hypothetical protein
MLNAFALYQTLVLRTRTQLTRLSSGIEKAYSVSRKTRVLHSSTAGSAAASSAYEDDLNSCKTLELLASVYCDRPDKCNKEGGGDMCLCDLQEVHFFKKNITHAAVAAKFSDRVALVIIPTIKENPVVKPAMIPNLAGMLCTTYKTTILMMGRRDESVVAKIPVKAFRVLSRYLCTP